MRTSQRRAPRVLGAVVALLLAAGGLAASMQRDPATVPVALAEAPLVAPDSIASSTFEVRPPVALASANTVTEARTARPSTPPGPPPTPEARVADPVRAPAAPAAVAPTPSPPGEPVDEPGDVSPVPRSGWQARCTAPADRVVAVGGAAELLLALTRARPGDRIELADGRYAGRFTASRSGTEAKPVTLCGSREAVLDAGGPGSGYGFHLRGDRWQLVGFTVMNAQKGIVLDGASHNVLDHVAVREVGHEGIHFRANSTRNTVVDSDVTGTGLRNVSFGEGIYVGSALQNWCRYSLCQPDASDGNALVDNRISATTAEAIDVKEGTTGGLIEGNQFDGTSSAAGAWVDIKGNDWTVRGNRGIHSKEDGFRTSRAAPGWGVGATFTGNVAEVHGLGYGFNLRPGSALRCDNVVAGAAKGFANQPCG